MEKNNNVNEEQQNIVGRTGFSDAELEEFKTVIHKKLEDAKEELEYYQEQIREKEFNDDDTKYAGLDDAANTNSSEYLSNMTNRMHKFISNLEAALIRIENKTYGICRKTGNLIEKRRLMAVPHATLSIQAKLDERKTKK